ncbi:MAG: hypothetical protein E6J90_15185 [Deltaproteobacteria bacterium]|nr:MAG: hypothetical protein E6J91_37695 [Deltaproteobacteria bacterium]TMQ20884.1 MAG: hypothetical protein E6J90_15185 [Deltaproteobacteria bacterium]
MAHFKITRPRSTPVTLTRSAHHITPDVALWVAISYSCNELEFRNYKAFIDDVMAAGSMRRAALPGDSSGKPREVIDEYDAAVISDPQRIDDGAPIYRLLPFSGSDRYALLKAATEVFVMAKCGVDPSFESFSSIVASVSASLEPSGGGIDLAQVAPALWEAYLDKIQPGGDKVIPYYGLIYDKLKDAPIDPVRRGVTAGAHLLLRQKLLRPCFLELIWVMWMELAMVFQTMNAILLRFQNVRLSDHDPLANMETDPLRPLNNLLWGLIQDEQHRLTVNRRNLEYNHQYGIGLVGKAVSSLRPADTRSRFIEAFHNLLFLAAEFYRHDDDTTIHADGFPLLNALKEVHLILSEGSHNQYGDLPSTARQEILMLQWILALPELRDFLPARASVAYPEPWMERVDAMRKIQHWGDPSVHYFRDLARFGEQIALSIRFGAWSVASSAEQGANWARYWRSAVQGYAHAYRVVTGVDLTTEPTSVEQTQLRYLSPSIHLQRRLAQQLQSLSQTPAGPGLIPTRAGKDTK